VPKVPRGSLGGGGSAPNFLKLAPIFLKKLALQWYIFYYSFFSAKQHYALRAIWYRLSDGPSVIRVDQSNTVQVRNRIVKFSPYGSPIPLVLRDKFHQKILTGSSGAGMSNKGAVGKRAIFTARCTLV